LTPNKIYKNTGVVKKKCHMLMMRYPKITVLSIDLNLENYVLHLIIFEKWKKKVSSIGFNYILEYS